MASASPLVNEMDPDTIDLSAEVAEAVQPALLRAPIEAARPVRQQFPQVTKVCALLTRRRLGPPRALDPGPQVGEDPVTHPDRERLRLKSSHPISLAGRQHPRHPYLMRL